MVNLKFILFGFLVFTLMGCELYKSPGRRDFENLNVYKIHIDQTELLCHKLPNTPPLTDQSCSYAENVFLFENTQCSSQETISAEEAARIFPTFCEAMKSN